MARGRERDSAPRQSPWRLALLVVAAVVVGVASAFAVTVLGERTESSRQAQTAAAQIRLDSTALATIALMAAGRDDFRAALEAQRADTVRSLYDSVAELERLLDDPAVTVDIRSAVDDFIAEIDRTNGATTAIDDPLTSLPALAWFRLDGALGVADGRAADRASAAGRIAVIGTWIILAFAGLLIAVLGGRVVAVRGRMAQLARQANTDALTGLANRAAFRVEIERAVTSPNPEDQPVSLLLIDVDRFKRVNDTHGHQAGDEVLAEVAQRLSAWVRGRDMLARLGGDEFAWLLHGCNPDDAARVAELALQAICDRPFDGVGSVGVSLGVATIAPGQDADALIRAADVSLYRAKRAGRGRVDGETRADVDAVEDVALV